MRIITEGAVPTEPTDPRQFSGAVLQTRFLTSADAAAATRFSYPPGTRSFWHVHHHEQIIYVLDGVGLIYWDGLDAARRLHAGDWLHVTPGVRHWHGATPEALFAHLAINIGPGVDWLTEVDEQDYLRAGAAPVH